MKNVIAVVDAVGVDIKEMIIFSTIKDDLKYHEKYLIGWKHGYMAANCGVIFNKISFRMEDV